MKTAKKKRAGQKRSKQAKRSNWPLGKELVQVVMANPGQSYDGDCACPLCAELAEAGEPVMVVEADGSERWVLPKKQPMMTVRVRGDASCPDLPRQGRDVQVPVGCILVDLLVYLSMKDELSLITPTGMAVATVGDHPFDPRLVLEPGDDILVSRSESAFDNLCAGM